MLHGLVYCVKHLCMKFQQQPIHLDPFRFHHGGCSCRSYSSVCPFGNCSNVFQCWPWWSFWISCCFISNRLCCKRPCLAKTTRLEFEFISCWNRFFRLQKSGFFDVKLALPFIVASIPAAFIGGYLQVDNTVYDILLSLTLVFAAETLFDQRFSFFGWNQQKPTSSYCDRCWFCDWFSKWYNRCWRRYFLSPIILLFGWSDPKTTAGISAVFIWVNSFSGLVGSTVSGQLALDVSTLIPFSIAVLIGGYIGSKFGSEKFSQNSIRNMLVAVMLIAAIRQILDLLGLMS